MDEPRPASQHLAGGYREYAPSPELGAHVECFWTSGPLNANDGSLSRPLTGGADRDAVGHRVLPDGCVDIIVECDDAHQRVYVVGTMTRAIVTGRNERTQFRAVRFRPGAARALFGLPASELTDLTVALDELWPEANAMLEQVAAAPTIAGSLRAMEQVLARRLRTAPRLGPDVQQAVRMIARAQGNLSIAALGPALGVTRQQLARRFAADVGISPKMFARVARMRATVDRVRGETDPDWPALALALGYYDQSHLVDDVRALTGLTPGQWARRR